MEMLRGLMFKKFYRVPTFLLKDADMMKCSALICNLEAILMFKPTNLTSVQAKLAVLEISFILYFGQHECAIHSGERKSLLQSEVMKPIHRGAYGTHGLTTGLSSSSQSFFR